MQRAADEDIVAAGARDRRGQEAERVHDAQRQRNREQRREQEVAAGKARESAEQRNGDHERRCARDEVDRHCLPRFDLADEPGGVADEQARGSRRCLCRCVRCHYASSFRQPTTNWWEMTRSSPSRTTTPCRRPVLYSDPELRASVRPMRVSPRDSWMCPCSPSSGCTSSISRRTAVLPTGMGTGCPPV